MASRLRWPAVLLGALVVVALLVYGPFDPMDRLEDDVALIDEDGAINNRHPLVRRVHRTEMELRTARVLHYEDAAFERLRAALPAEPSIAVEMLPGVEFQMPSYMSDSSRAARVWQDRLDRFARVEGEMAAISDDSRTRMAIVEVQSPYDDTEWSGAESALRYFAGRDSVGAYCGITFKYVHDLDDYDGLGPCRLWVRFGPPSPDVAEWLAGRGHVLAFESVLTERYTEARRRMFGLRGGAMSWDAPQSGLKIEACIAGREDACLPAAFDPDEWVAFGTPWIRHAMLAAPRWGGEGSLIIGGLFGELENEIGEERMRDIWTTSTDPRADLEAALGVDLDEWLMEWMRHNIGVEPLGPVPDTETLIRSLLMIAVLLGTSVWIVGRRHIG